VSVYHVTPPGILRNCITPWATSYFGAMPTPIAIPARSGLERAPAWSPSSVWLGTVVRT